MRKFNKVQRQSKKENILLFKKAVKESGFYPKGEKSSKEFNALKDAVKAYYTSSKIALVKAELKPLKHKFYRQFWNFESGNWIGIFEGNPYYWCKSQRILYRVVL